MKGRRSAMTLIEMIVCLAIVAICFAALVRGIGSMGLLAAQEEEDAALVAAIETRLGALEAAPPEARSGRLTGGWYYETQFADGVYILHVYHVKRGEAHDFLIREGPL